MKKYVIEIESIRIDLFSDGYEAYWDTGKVCYLLGFDNPIHVMNTQVARGDLKTINDGEKIRLTINEFGLIKLIGLSNREFAKEFLLFVKRTRNAINQLNYWTAYSAGYLKGVEKGFVSCNKRTEICTVLYNENNRLDKVISSKELTKNVDEIMYFLNLDTARSTKMKK
jgi:hypothetical protein